MVKDLIAEVDAFIVAAKDFISQDTMRALRVCKDDLRSAASSRPAGTFPWGIPDRDGLRLRTIGTTGFEPGDRRVAHSVIGEMTFKWELRLTPATRTRQIAHQRVSIAGNASITTRILNAETHSVIAEWQLEMGAADSPGTYFHVGVGHREDFFPTSLSVPRLPAVLVTPTDALDFMLGELFQTGWRQANAKESDANKVIGKHQRTRITRALQWQASQIPSDCSGSAWNVIKHAKPCDQIFVEE